MKFTATPSQTPCPQCAEPHLEVDVYPVGALSAIRGSYRAVRARRFRQAWVWLAREARHVRWGVRSRDWRAVKNTFNGYLAEPYHWPDGMRRCGSGWTRRRAMASLRRQGWSS